jgi:hypothetical protein
VNDRLTLNLGVRYDVSPGDFTAPDVRETDVIIDNGLFVTNAGYRNNLRDYNNVAPRVGFAWNVTGSGNMVIRGGTGLFYGHVGGNPSWDQQLWNGQRVIFNSYQNDRQPGFFADPTRGVTAEDILSGRVPLAPQSLSVIDHDIQTPYSWQSMLGFQRRLSEVMSVDADLVFKKGYHFETQNDPNLFYRPAAPRLRTVPADRHRRKLRIPGTGHGRESPLPQQLPVRRHLHLHVLRQQLGPRRRRLR